MRIGARVRLSIISSTFIIAVAVPLAAEEGENGSFIFATGFEGGRYNTVGNAISELLAEKVPADGKITLDVIETAGFGHNVELIRGKEAQFAIQQAMYGYFDRAGTGPLTEAGAHDDLRSIGTLWRDAEHVLIRKEDAKTGTIEDFLGLQGRSVSLGQDRPGAIDSNRLLFANLGVDIDKRYDLAHLSYPDSAKALQAGEIVGMSTPSRAPAGHINDTLSDSGDDIAILEFTDEQLEKVDAGIGLWTRYLIPAGTYPGQDSDIQTAAKSNFLAAHASVDEDVVYALTKAIFDNLDTLRNATTLTRETSLEEALTGLTVPLHPGALRFYKEMGLVPDDASPAIVVGQSGTADGSNGTALETVVAVAEETEAVTIGERTASALIVDEETDAAPADDAATKTFVVYFGSNQAALTVEAKETLLQALAHAEDLEGAGYAVSGHGDRAGPDDYNLFLSRLRADIVVKELLTHGVASERIETAHYGEAQPMVETADGAAEAQNRRVEITVSKLGS